jgi:long-chain acyl-CoA synthetase
MANNLAVGLAAMGIGRGDRVAIMSRPRIRFAAAIIAIARLGGWTVPIDPTLTRPEVTGILTEAEVKAIFAPAELFDRLPTEGPPLIDFDEGPTGTPFSSLLQEGEPPEPTLSDQEIAILAYTSGTTGEAKGVMLSHGNLTADIEACIEIMPITEEDVFLTIAPWHHILGLTTALLLPLYTGALTIYTDDYRAIAKLLEENQVTIFTAVPKLYHTMYDKLMAQIEGSLSGRIAHKLVPRIVGKKVKDSLTGGNLRFFVSGSAPLSPRVSLGFRRLGIGLLEGYGLTETSPVVSFCSPDSTKGGSVGAALPSIEVRLEDVRPDGVGELLVRGPTVMAGYYKNERATNEVIDADGWFHTGDLALIDDDGDIFLKGRAKNVIVLETGKNVYPEEIEWEISRIPYIEEVLARGGTRAGKEIVEVVIYPNRDRLEKEGLLEDTKETIWKEIKQRQRRLAPHKRIRKKDHVIIVEQPFPKTSTMDIKRHLYKGGNDLPDD